jgi:ATP-dependent DNA helicase RecG
MQTLEIPISDLLNGQTVEDVRLEFKKTWNKIIASSVAQTICAFANDLQGRYGGYVILGVEEIAGKPILPPHGLNDLDLDKVQKEIRIVCKTRISPNYIPNIFLEQYQDKSIIVIWVQPGEERPYKSRNDVGKDAPFAYFVRIGPETIEVKENDPLSDQLMQLTVSIPFDERKRYDVHLSAISDSLLRRALLDMKSDLIAPDTALDTLAILRQMRLSARTNGSEAPKNVALLFFTDAPEAYIPGAMIEMAQFRDNGDLIETRTFRGPLHLQAKNVLEHLDNLLGNITQKVPGHLQAERFVAFPYDAMREAIVNAIYHRGYEQPPVPIKIGLYPDRMEITSYPGPVPGLQREHLEPGAHPPQLPARNPHIGDLLKRLRLAETWLTGIPKIRRRMQENGSPQPKFDFDDTRTYFRVSLPAHPGYVVLHGIREAATLWHSGDRTQASVLAADLHRLVPASGAVAALRIDFAGSDGDLVQARQILNEFVKNPEGNNKPKAIAAMTRVLLEQADRAITTEDAIRLQREAQKLLKTVPLPQDPTDAIERAILHKRSGDFKGAHNIFSSIESSIQNDPKALHEYAQTKNRIAASLKGPTAPTTRKNLNREAAAILRRVVALSADQPLRAAWAWFDLARTLQWAGSSDSEIRTAIEKAQNLGNTDPQLLGKIQQFLRNLR